MQTISFQILFWLFLSSLAPLGRLHATSDTSVDPIECECNPEPVVCNPGHHLLFGPEIFYVKRKRDNKVRQNGWLAGGRIIYEYYRRYCFYLGLEGSYARGTLRGHAKNNRPIKSRMNDYSIEGRLGYTFKCKIGWKPAFTPFIGGGYLWECNNFIAPTPISFHFKTHSPYATAGFLAAITPSDCFSLGLNLKVRYLIDPKCHVSHDSDNDPINLPIGNDELQYRLELPLAYLAKDRCWGITLMPFYEKRFYGGRAAYPQDFAETRFVNYGANLMLAIYF